MTSGKEGSKKKTYSKRIARLRKLIVGAVIASCLIPTCICVILAIKCDRLSTAYAQSQADLEWYRGRFGTEMEILAGSDSGDALASLGSSAFEEPVYEEDFESDMAIVDLSGAQNPEDIEGVRYVYLTFDDGPSSSTNDILDILAEYDVKATFFVCGKPDARYTDVYKRIVDEGHTLGMHSYSHKYSTLYSSVDAFSEDFEQLRLFLVNTTGVWSKYYRFPGGSSNDVSKVPMTDFVSVLDDADVTFFDWNVSAGDDRAGATKETIYNNIVSNVPRFKHCVVLLHDAADKKSTVEALPEIIEAILAMDDTVIVPITDDTLPVQHIKY
ncbi:polysaccharide deacetylase family protein [Butyrivibrio proteoclasticus]|uniref:polysaccharide deacetylase family protein n=1 Tax=Butyrivibrio proteoclasticus TaxID=43305 RepID=UPI00047E64AE|nr:polysaccharide deacetylase family protein [Butyrivibrio proteoclasticus]